MILHNQLRAWYALIRAASGGLWRDNPGRLLLSIFAIAAGVALGVAVHLINASAINEMNQAMRSLTGEADLVVRGAASGFDENIYARIARMPEVRAAAPALELHAQIANNRETLKVLGIDPLRSMQVQPGLIGEKYNKIINLLNNDRVLLSATAASMFGLAENNRLSLRAGSANIAFEVAGVLDADAHNQPVAIMDIATAQWRFNRLGVINRIDIRLHAGTDPARYAERLQRELPAGVHVVPPQLEAVREAGITRAYRVNLDMLALVALFTGAFLVYATQTLSVLRRRTQLAFLRAVGVTRTQITALLIGESTLIGTIGSVLGIAGGYGFALLIVTHVGADLGAGYFRTLSASLYADPFSLAAYFALGVAFAVFGAAGAAIEAGRRPPAAALHAGDEDAEAASPLLIPVGVLLIIVGIALTAAPRLAGLPLAGYGAIALILLGTVLLTPWMAAQAVRVLPALRTVPSQLAIERLRATPRQVALGITAILVSFSLMLSMLVMVTSFRASLQHWLTQMLPADLYVRASRAGDTGFLTPTQQSAIAAVPGVTQSTALRTQALSLRADRPRVTLIARQISASTADTILPLRVKSGNAVSADAGAPPAWISEAVADLYNYAPGDHLELPIGGKMQPFTVAGIWRDYVRQNGAIVIDRDLYNQLTGDTLASEMHLVLAAHADPAQIAAAIQKNLVPDAQVEVTSAQDVRAASLHLFDRTFAVTYALEIAAALIGLFGLSSAVSAQVISRRREFGALRHIGMTSAEIRTMIGWEGAYAACIGAAFGAILGIAISLILIHVVNRQSFHWSMDLHMPWAAMAGACVILIAAAAATAMLSARRAMDGGVLRAVRDDW